MRHGDDDKERDLFWFDNMISTLENEDGSNYDKTCLQIKYLMLSHPTGIYISEVLNRTSWHSKKHVIPIIRNLIIHDYIIVFDLSKVKRRNSISKVMVCLNSDEDIGNWLSWM